MTEARREAPSWRPFVTMNVAESADGKIAPVDGGKVNFGSVEDRMQMEALRAEADGVLIGGGTLRTEDPPLLIRDPSVREPPEIGEGDAPSPEHHRLLVAPRPPREHELLPQPGDREARLHDRADPAIAHRRRRPGSRTSRSSRSIRRAASISSRSSDASSRWGYATSCWRGAES